MNSFIAAYNRAPALSVYGAYKHPSEAKIHAERAVLREMTKRNGWGLQNHQSYLPAFHGWLSVHRPRHRRYYVARSHDAERL